MNENEGEQMLLAALDAQLQYVRHESAFKQANRSIRAMVHELRVNRENPLDHQTAIANRYIESVREANEAVATNLENDLELLARAVGRTCLFSFYDEIGSNNLKLVGESIYNSFSMRVIRSGLEPSIPAQLTYGFGLVPYIEAAASFDDELLDIPGVRFNPAPDIGNRTISFPWSVVDKIEFEE